MLVSLGNCVTLQAPKQLPWRRLDAACVSLIPAGLLSGYGWLHLACPDEDAGTAQVSKEICREICRRCVECREVFSNFRSMPPRVGCMPSRAPVSVPQSNLKILVLQV